MSGRFILARCRSCGLDAYDLLDGFCPACLPDLEWED